ncbi:MAG: glutamate carboxypeptidase [Oceanicoccus sp.]|jgi:glutamate carboxypeptidase
MKTNRLFLLVISFTVASSVFAAEIQGVPAELNDVEKRMVSWVDSRQSEMLDELEKHVELNTGTENIAGIDQYRSIIERQLQGLGFATQLHSSDPLPVLSCNGGKTVFADHLEATRKGKKKNRVLLNGHLDTVFPAHDKFQTLQVEGDGTLRGPGVADMKGGLVVMLYALKALDAEGRLADANITVFLNTDEEIGSLGSRRLIEDIARKHDVGLVFESSHNNKMTRSRKGLGQARLKITGRESHAGAAHERGVSANLELAHKVIAIEKLTNYEQQVTVNVGVMSGGEKRNTVPGCSDAYIDLRYPTSASGKELQSKISQISADKTFVNTNFPDLPKIEVWTKLHRPAKVRDKMVDQLISESMGLSEVLGEKITGTRFSGGGTDGSIMQSVGLSTLDSLGVDGEGAHSSREKTSLKSLIARTKLATVMISRQIDK